MWFKCVGVALVVGASALCFPLQAAAQSEYAAPVGTAHSDLQSMAICSWRNIVQRRSTPGAASCKRSPQAGNNSA